VCGYEVGGGMWGLRMVVGWRSSSRSLCSGASHQHNQSIGDSCSAYLIQKEWPLISWADARLDG